MAKKKINSGLSLLFGLTFLSPVTYSVLAYEMDVVQRMFFFSVSLLLFLVFILKVKLDKAIQLNKLLLILFILFPFTFFIAFINGSGSLLILKLSDLIIPLSIFLQSALMIIILGEDKFFKVVSFSVVIVSTLFSIVGVLEVFQLKIIPLPSVIPPGSTLGHRSFTAEYLLSALPFFLLANEYVIKERKYFLLIAAIVNVSFLLFTRNRAGLLILIFVTVLYIIFIFIRKVKGNKLKILAPVLFVLVISFLISLIPVKGTERPDFQSTAETFFDSEFRSNILRVNFWDASIQMIKENPLSGVGLFKWSGFYPKYYGDYFNDDNVTNIHNIHAHNDFLELFAENGILAPLIFLLIFVSVAYSLSRRIKYNEKYFLLLLTFLITTAYSLVAFPNHKFSSYFLAAITAGTVLVEYRGLEKHTLSIKFSHLKWAFIFLIIIGGSASYVKLRSELLFGESIYLKEIRQYAYMLQKLEGVSRLLYPLDSSKQPVDYYRGIANYYLGRLPEALRINLSAQELAPFNPTIMVNIAASYQALGKLQSAIKQYERVQKYFPNYIRPQINLLYVYSEAGQVEKAKSLLNELMTKYPENPGLQEFIKKYHSE